MTEVEAGKLLALLVTAWPDGMRWLDAAQQAETRRMYREFLLDLPYPSADAAVRRMIATWRPTSARAWPSIAELRAAIVAQRDGREVAGGEAWGALLALRSPRPEADLQAIDPVLRRCLEAFGWITWDTVFRSGAEVRRWRVVLGDPGAEPADRARFLELYAELQHRDTTDRVVGEVAPPIPTRRLVAGEPLRLGGIVQGLLPEPKKKGGCRP